MRSEKWKKVEEIFLAALECEPSERAIFLDRACWNDPLVREEVESLLDNADARISIIDNPLFEAVGDPGLEASKRASFVIEAASHKTMSSAAVAANRPSGE